MRDSAPYDLILRGGTLVDGSGAAPRTGDLAVTGGRIAAVGAIAHGAAARELDVTGRAVAPGFVDIHSHTDMILTLPPERQAELMRGRLLQGITTEAVGNCGLGVFPVDGASREPVAAFHRFLIPDDARFAWETTGEYLAYLERRPLLLNAAALVPHNPVRLKVMGPTDRRPSARELAAMRREIDQALDAGAHGLSFGLIYFPGRFARTGEIIELARSAAERGGIVAFHQRTGSPEVVTRAIDEIIEVGERSGARVHVSHDHVQGRPGWSLVDTILERERAARERGVRLTVDVIPYTGVTTTMLAIYPPWSLAGGVAGFLSLAAHPDRRRTMKREMETVVPRWPPWTEGAWATNIVRDCGWEAVFVGHVGSAKNKECEGLSAVELAALRRCEPFDAVTDILIEERGDVGLRLIGISGDLKQEDPLLSFLRDPDHAIISDAWDVGRGKPHPGVYGAFPRVLGRYVRECGVLTLEEAVRKMTSLPASILGLGDRGLLREGFRADLVVFDPERVAERATYDAPRQPPDGIDHVFVNGREAAAGGELTAERAGSVIRG